MSTEGTDKQPDTISLRIDPSVLTFKGFLAIEEAFLDLLRAVSDEASAQLDKPGGEWIIETVREGSITLVTRHSTAPENAQYVSAGLKKLEEADGERPALFTDEALEATRTLFDRLESQAEDASISHEAFKTFVNRELADNARAALGPEQLEIGAVEGRLEGINIHERKRFTVYDSLTDRRIVCNFGSRIPLSEITDAIDKRVAVTGELRYRQGGDLLSVRAETLKVFRPDSHLPSAADASAAFWGS